MTTAESTDVSARQSLPGGFAATDRGGSGSPLVLIHGITDTLRTWELVRPALQRRHDVLAVTLPGHAGGPPLADPVRIIWGTEDRLLGWPRAARRYQEQLPQADWVILDGVGHSPQLDVPLETAQLILGHTAA